MATTAELARPGVEILQTFRSVSTTFLRPTLVPAVVGPAFEVINVLTSDGTINPKAKYGTYLQIGKTITHSSFPDPRSNIDELDIQADSVRPFMLSGGKLSELLMNPGEGFLNASNAATKPAFRVIGNSFAVNGKTLIIAIDQPIYNNYTKDVVITFPGSSSLSAQQVCDAINAAFGMDVATTITGGWQLASPNYGALASVTVRASGSANSYFNLGYINNSTAASERVVGAGYRAQDQGDNSTQSSWIEFYNGGYFVNGVITTPPGTKTQPVSCTPGFVSVDDESFSSSAHADVTFGDSTTLPIQVGDQFFADGQQVVAGEIIRVETSRFRVGTVNPLLSTADSRGRYTTKVHDPKTVGLLTDAVSPFAPAYVWFKACGLDATNSPTAAYLTGSVAGVAAQPASVSGDTAPVGPFSLADLTLHVIVVNEGVSTESTFTFPAGTYDDMSAVASVISIPGVYAENDVGSGGKLKLTTTATGRTVTISVLPDGYANSALGFSTSIPTTGSGKDPEKSGLTGKVLNFSFDRSAHVYSVTFPTDSLFTAADTINSLVGTTVASVSGTLHLVLTSPLAGVSSQVTVFANAASNAANSYVGMGVGSDQVSVNGTGRPYPEAYLDDGNNLVINSQILRHPVTGYPNDFTTTQGALYIQFKALRKDVSPVAKNAGVVRIPDITTLASVMDPITEENPGGLGAYLCMLNCPGYEVKFMGVDEVSATAPYGTELAWARAASFLEAEEVYAIAPLTQNESVLGMWVTHATLMSEPEQSGERIVFINKAMPTTKNSQIVASGSQANSTATLNQLLVEVTPQEGLVQLGLNPAAPFTVDQGVYVEFEWDGLNYKYNVISVSGGLLNLRVSYSSDQNADGF